MRTFANLLLGFWLTMLAFVGLHSYMEQPSFPPPPPSAASHYNSIRDSIYKVTDSAGTRGGTGFKVKRPNGRPVIVTNSHVCRGVADKAGGLYVTHESVGRPALGRIVQEDPLHDLCIIVIALDDGRPALSMGEHSPKMGDEVWTQGHGALAPQYPRQGVAQGLTSFTLPTQSATCDGPFEGWEEVDGWLGPVKYCARTFTAMGVAFQVIPGCSGSPLLNVDNEVVGVIFAGRNDGAGAFAVEVEHLHALLLEKN